MIQGSEHNVPDTRELSAIIKIRRLQLSSRELLFVWQYERTQIWSTYPISPPKWLFQASEPLQLHGLSTSSWNLSGLNRYSSSWESKAWYYTLATLRSFRAGISSPCPGTTWSSVTCSLWSHSLTDCPLMHIHIYFKCENSISRFGFYWIALVPRTHKSVLRNNRVFFRLERSVVKCLDLKKLFRFKYFTGEGSEFRTDVSFSIVWSLIAAAWSSISASKRDLDTWSYGFTVHELKQLYNSNKYPGVSNLDLSNSSGISSMRVSLA